MNAIVLAIRNWLCRHNYRPSKFQPLVPGTSYECSKCGKIIHHD